MKLLVRIIKILLVILLVLVLFRNVIIKTAVSAGAKVVTGLDLKIQSLKVGLIDSSIRIENFKIYNPKNFEEKIMLDIPKVVIDYNLGDILGGLIHLEEVTLHLTKFNVVRNKDGVLNLDSLKVVKQGEEKTTPKEEPKKKKPGKAPKIKIDLLDLNVGKISFMDYSKDPANPSINTFEFNLNEKHENITNPQVIIALIVQKAMLKASIAKISGFDLGNLQGALGSTLGGVQSLASTGLDSATKLSSGAIGGVKNIAENPVGSVSYVGEKTLDSAKDVAESTLSTLKDQASNLKGLASRLNPLSKDE